MRDSSWLLDNEQQYLSTAGTRSDSPVASKRLYKEKSYRSGYRLSFQRDRDRILHSEAFRRLMHKSQIFPSPLLSQYRTRLTHTLEVTQVARSISRRLGLNEDLTEAIAMGHDLGHAPFGHMGEDIIRQLLVKTHKDKNGFEHNEHSLDIIDNTEECDTINGICKGMNLTQATRQGILCHTRYRESDYPDGKEIPQNWIDLGYSSKDEIKRQEQNKNHTLIKLLTPEAQVVDISDEIAYLTHDLEDCRRSGLIKIKDVTPKELQRFMGAKRKNALNALIDGVCNDSLEHMQEDQRNPNSYTKIGYPEELDALVQSLKVFFRNQIFDQPSIKRQNEEGQSYIKKLFKYWSAYPPAGIEATPQNIAKFIARLTDQEVIYYYQEHFTPRFTVGVLKP